MTALVALLAMLASAVLMPPPVPASRLPQPRAPERAPTSRAVAVRWVAGIALGAGTAVMLGGVLGVIAGMVLGTGSVLGIRWLGGLGDRAQRDAVRAQAPLACDLLASVLASGAGTQGALGATAEAVGAPIGPLFASVQARLALGSDARGAWGPLLDDPSLGGIAMAMVRCAETGAPLVESLRRAAADLRIAHRAHLLARARVLGVRAVLPLGLCFLPAFLLLGVVPVVVSLVSQVLNLH